MTRKAFDIYIQHGRRIGGRRARSSAPASTASNGTDTKAVRQWASENGYDVSARGRIPGEIVEAYKAAQR